MVTNPHFSLFREYVLKLIENGKEFLIIGGQNAITYKEIFKLIKENKIWLGIDNGGKKMVSGSYHIMILRRIKDKDRKWNQVL